MTKLEIANLEKGNIIIYSNTYYQHTTTLNEYGDPEVEDVTEEYTMVILAIIEKEIMIFNRDTGRIYWKPKWELRSDIYYQFMDEGVI